MFDLLIALGPNDTEFVKKSIAANKQNIIGYRNIYIVTQDSNFHLDGCITIPEDNFSFSKDDINRIAPSISTAQIENRDGWCWKQLMNFYAGFEIDGILDNYLTIDADTWLIKPTKFLDNDLFLFSYSHENHKPYFDHMLRLHPSFKKYSEVSGIAHHMMFNKTCVYEMMKIVEEYHGLKFYEAFLKSIVCKDKESWSFCAEYEIYFNYMIKYHPEKIKLRLLQERIDIASSHWYARGI